MRTCRSAFVAVLSLCLGCQSTYSGSGMSAELCNTPGRKALADSIVARGGLLIGSESSEWDNSVDAATKEKMGPPLSKVVLPQDKFNAQDVTAAQNIFPEAQVSAPITLDDSEAADSDGAGP